MDRLPKSKIQDPKGVELTFCKEMEKMSFSKPMDKEQMKLLAMAQMVDIGEKDPFDDVPKAEQPFAFQLVKQSVYSRFTIEMSNSLCLLIATMGESAGGCIALLAYVQYKAKKKGKRKVNSLDFVNIFPMGFPSQEQINKAWGAQKVNKESTMGSDNLLDYQSALKSIQFSEN